MILLVFLVLYFCDVIAGSTFWWVMLGAVLGSALPALREVKHL